MALKIRFLDKKKNAIDNILRSCVYLFPEINNVETRNHAAKLKKERGK